MLIEINGKRVLITGGSGSIGRALVEVFSKSGGQVSFQFNSNVSAASALELQFGARSFQRDFLKSFELPTYDYDILVNNVGINISKHLSESVSLSEWENTIRVNVTVPYYLVQNCLPYMIKNNWGRIVNISSIYGLRGSSNNLPYNASKHAMSGLTKTVAREYAHYGITCNEICPGPVESQLMERIAKQKESETGIPKEDYFRSLYELIPARRFAKPMEVAQLALCLASDFSSYINGTSIPIDGALIA